MLLPTEYHTRRKYNELYQKSSNISVVFPLIVVPISAGIPFALVICIIFTEYDPAYFVLEEILPNPMYRIESTIYMAMVTRLFCGFFGGIQFTRCCTLFLGMLLIALDRVRTLFHDLISGSIPAHKFQKFYTPCLIAILKIEIWVHRATYLALCGIFWATTAGCWILVRRGPSQITLAVYFFIFIATTLLIAAHVFLIPIVCDTLELILVAVKVHKLRTKIMFSKSKTKGNKIVRLQAEAVLAFRLKYGEFLYLEKNFVPDYLLTLLNRCIDTIMVFV